MALTLRISADGESQDWALPQHYLEELNTLQSRAQRVAQATLLGPDDMEFGKSWQVSRSALIGALETLLKSRSKDSRGFQMRYSPPGTYELVGSGMASGFRIGGVYHCIDCRDFGWYLGSFEKERIVWGPARCDTTEITTENLGIVRIERRKGGKQALLRLLDELMAFVRRQQSDTLTLTLG